jgi:probable HAF family extracellular repeat protein
MTVLQPLPGDSVSRVDDVNAQGVAVGASTSAAHAQRPVRWASLTASPTVVSGQAGGEAVAINTGGEIIGTNTIWMGGNAIPVAGTLTAINDAGKIVGYTTTSDGQHHATTWTATG